MRLSEKGLSKVYEIEAQRVGVVTAYYEDLEFEPDDFDDGVMLTINEARLIRAWFDRVMLEDNDLVELSVKVFDPLFYRLDRVDPVEKQE